MSKHSKLELEILTGPLDGHIVLLDTETEWTRQVGSQLSFPWDEELGEPQARFSLIASGWQLERANAKRGTHVLRQDVEESLPAVLVAGDIVKASNTWMCVKST